MPKDYQAKLEKLLGWEVQAELYLDVHSDPESKIYIEVVGELMFFDRTKKFYVSGEKCSIDIPIEAIRDIHEPIFGTTRIILGDFRASA